VPVLFVSEQPLPDARDDLEQAAGLFEASLHRFFQTARMTRHPSYLKPALECGQGLAKVMQLLMSSFEIGIALAYRHDDLS
jgi:hypothetical protein